MRLLVLLILLFCATSSGAAELDRSKGLSAHFLPKRVADADKSGSVKWGFVASTSEMTSRPAKDRPTFQSVADLISYYKRLDPETQRNGIWVVTSNPEAYSAQENAMLEELKAQCKAHRIPLFIARGKDLPKGWQRHSALEVIRARNSSLTSWCCAPRCSGVSSPSCS